MTTLPDPTLSVSDTAACVFEDFERLLDYRSKLREYSSERTQDTVFTSLRIVLPQETADRLHRLHARFFSRGLVTAGDVIKEALLAFEDIINYYDVKK